MSFQQDKLILLILLGLLLPTVFIVRLWYRFRESSITAGKISRHEMVRTCVHTAIYSIFVAILFSIMVSVTSTQPTSTFSEYYLNSLYIAVCATPIIMLTMVFMFLLGIVSETQGQLKLKKHKPDI